MHALQSPISYINPSWWCLMIVNLHPIHKQTDKYPNASVQTLKLIKTLNIYLFFFWSLNIHRFAYDCDALRCAMLTVLFACLFVHSFKFPFLFENLSNYVTLAWCINNPFYNKIYLYTNKLYKYINYQSILQQ